MKRESVNKFDLEAAFKALNEVEIPVVKGIRPSRENLQEKFTKKLVTDVLVEDYFDINDSVELEQAQEEREAEIAKAKLARIEKIVDLEAETEEDLLPSYIGKLIMQCPQCMTLFYKNEEDIEKSDENPEVVNLNEPCQHCGNSSGYTLIGKVGNVGEDEAENYDVEDFEDNELNLDFEEEETAEESEESVEETEETEEVAAEEEEDLELEPVEETEEESSEEEEVQESLSLKEDWEADVAKADKLLDEIIKESGNDKYDDGDGYWSSEDEWCNRYMYYANSVANHAQVEELCKKHSTDKCTFYVLEDDAEEDPVSEIGYTLTKSVKEALTEDVDKDLDAKLKAHNDYIDYLKKMIKQEEEALGRADNEYVKKAIQRRLDAFKADLEEALPDAIKNDVTVSDLPTPEEADMGNAAENNSEEKEEKADTKKESLTEDLETERKLDEVETELENTNAEDYVVEEVKKPAVVAALDELEAELTEDAKASKAKYEVSDAEFRAMLKNPVFNEACKECKEELAEDLPPVSAAPFEKAADAIENAGSELTPEEQKLEDEELAAKEGIEENLTESADLFADDGTLATLIYPDRLSPEARKEKLLADPDFVKALEAFAQNYNMVAKPEDLEDGVTLVDDMYDCAFEGIEGEDLEEVLDELISYYVDIKAGAKLTEAAPQGEFVSKLKRNYSATELIVKELKGHHMFSSLSTRTIQRILLPYYIENMGRAGLSAQSMIDFFTEEGFAPYVLDHFFIMDPLARKELLLADAKFMEIFNAWAREYDAYPGSVDELAPGETKFGYALDVIFLLDGGNIYKPALTKAVIKAFGQMYIKGSFDKAIAEATGEAKESDSLKSTEVVILDSAEDLDENSFNKFTGDYLTEVYSNVKAFEATGCELKDNKLVVEGIITFNSGKTKSTTFVYEATEVAESKVILEGLNADFATEKAFILNCNIDKANCLIVESLNYKYTINNTLVEGLIK